jgi:hypothetical protein
VVLQVHQELQDLVDPQDHLVHPDLVEPPELHQIILVYLSIV